MVRVRAPRVSQWDEGPGGGNVTGFDRSADSHGSTGVRLTQLDRRSSTGVPITLFDRLQSHAVQTAWASRRPTLVTQVMALRQPSFFPAQRIASWRRTKFMHSQRSDREGKHPVKYN